MKDAKQVVIDLIEGVAPGTQMIVLTQY